MPEVALQSLVVVIAKDIEGNVIGQGSGFFVERIRPKSGPDLESVRAILDGATDANVEAIRNRRVWVVTNLHVIKWAAKVDIKEIRSGSVLPVVEAVGFDLNNDLCLLKVKNPYSGVPLRMADSDKISVGDSVFVAGNPKGLEGTISKGIISSLRTTEKLIQTDASVSPGSSGGPVLNERGEVIGVVVGMLSGGQNLNFVIPSNLVSRINLNRTYPIKMAGAIAVTTKERDKLLGPVKRLQVLEARPNLDNTGSSVTWSTPNIQSETEYDTKGSAVSVTDYSNGKLRFRHQYSYGSLGCVSRKVSVDSEGKETAEEVPENECLDRKAISNMFSEEVTFGNDSYGKLTFRYDRFGNQIEEILTRNGRVIRTNSVYDNNGLLTEQRYSHDKDYSLLRKFEYKFDRTGNWIEQIETTHPSYMHAVGVKTRVVFRKIDYFER